MFDKKVFGHFLHNVMQTQHPPPPLKSGQFEFLVPKDAQCSETYTKTIYQFFRKFSFDRIFILSFWDLGIFRQHF